MTDHIDPIDNPLQHIFTCTIATNVKIAAMFPHAAPEIREINETLEAVSDDWRAIAETADGVLKTRRQVPINFGEILRVLEATRQVHVDCTYRALKATSNDPTVHAEALALAQSTDASWEKAIRAICKNFTGSDGDGDSCDQQQGGEE